MARLCGAAYLSLIGLTPHPVCINQAHVLARVVTSRRLVVLHQLAPAEHVAQVELPGTALLAPQPLHTHLLNQLQGEGAEVAQEMVRSLPVSTELRKHLPCY